MTDGTVLDMSDDTALGVTLGRLDGAILGMPDGIADNTALGDKLEMTDGTILDMSDGTALGLTLGTLDGVILFVGIDDGFLLGFKSGD